MDWLKELLKGVVAEDQIDSVVDKFNKEFPKHAVPKSEFNSINEELKISKQTIEQTNKTLEELKTEVGTVEEYKSKIDKLNADVETVKAESKKQVDNIVKKVNFEKLLLDSKMTKSAAKLIADTYNLDDIMIDSTGNIVEADKHVSKLKEVSADLFIEVTQQSTETNKTKDQQPPGKSFADMSIEEVMESRNAKGITR